MEETKAYWNGEIFFAGGYAWATHLQDRNFEFIRLGREQDILPVLKGDKPMGEELTPVQRQILASLLEQTEGNGAKSRKHATSGPRSRK